MDPINKIIDMEIAALTEDIKALRHKMDNTPDLSEFAFESLVRRTNCAMKERNRLRQLKTSE